MRRLPTICLTPLLAAIAAAAPVVKNPSFEADHYGKYPGLAAQNGGLTGWNFTGNVGVNPWWRDPVRLEGPKTSFSDNGKIPHGRQVALMQNVCTLSQRIPGFVAGRRYQVQYFENSRHSGRPNDRPVLTVTLGGETVVSPHKVRPVDEFNRFVVPYDRVVSAQFTAPKDGAFELVFQTLVSNRVTALIDMVRVIEVH